LGTASHLIALIKLKDTNNAEHNAFDVKRMNHDSSASSLGKGQPLVKVGDIEKVQRHLR
jgi:hypothetical protein